MRVADDLAAATAFLTRVPTGRLAAFDRAAVARAAPLFPLGGVTRERRLEIMRDHAIGSFGAVTLVVVLLFEASALSAEGSAWSAFAAAAACGRWAALPHAAFLTYARPGEPVLRTSWKGVLLGLLVAGAVALGVRGVSGLAAIGTAAAVALVLGAFFRRWLGGVTGDTLGATTELAQAAALAALLVAG